MGNKKHPPRVEGTFNRGSLKISHLAPLLHTIVPHCALSCRGRWALSTTGYRGIANCLRQLGRLTISLASLRVGKGFDNALLLFHLPPPHAHHTCARTHTPLYTNATSHASFHHCSLRHPLLHFFGSSQSSGPVSYTHLTLPTICSV